MQQRLDHSSLLFQRLRHEVLLYGGFLRIKTSFRMGREAPGPKGNRSGKTKLGSFRRTPLALYNGVEILAFRFWHPDSDLKGRAFSDCLAFEWCRAPDFQLSWMAAMLRWLLPEVATSQSVLLLLVTPLPDSDLG